MQAGDDFYSEGYGMCIDYGPDFEGNPTIELWRFATEGDCVEGYGHLHIHLHEIVETSQSGTLAVYYRQWFAPDGKPAWGNQRKRKIASLGSLKGLISRRKMTGTPPHPVVAGPL